MSIKNIEDALVPYDASAYAGANNHLKLEAELKAACTREIAVELDKLTTQLAGNATQSSKLNSRIFILNIVLTAATVVIAFSAFMTNPS